MSENDKCYITSDKELVIEANNLHSALKNLYNASFVNMHESDLNFKMIMFHLVSKVVYTSKVVEACG